MNIIEVNEIINGLYVKQLVSFKYYMENICGYKVTKDSSSIYQSGYFFNPNKEWCHVSSLGNPNDVKMKIRELKLKKLI